MASLGVQGKGLSTPRHLGRSHFASSVIFGALAEFERNLIKERTIAGLVAARARGKSGGRPKRSPKSSKVTLARKLYADKSNTVGEICKTLHISRATLYRYIRE
jgi:DNA invertase Pin-like site-specific DNA recombinase